MALTKRPRKATDERALDKFVEEAPEARGKSAKENKQAISLTVFPSLIKAVDKAAAKRGISRAAFFSMAASRMIDDEENR
jgi:hypothetical protein